VVTVPASVWRGGRVARALTVGVAAGLFLGALALLDSGVLLAAVVVFVLVGIGWAIVMDRRMIRYWPGAGALTGERRVIVVRAARRGERVSDPSLAQAVVEYRDGLHAAAEKARHFRWLIWLVLAVAAAMAVWDTVAGSTRDGVASCAYLALLLLEVSLWPKVQERLLANADRAAEMAGQIETSD
jgi:hypothetical protein